MFPLNVSGIDAVQELLRSNEKLFQGYRNLLRLRDEDVDIATTPKEEVHRIDKTVLYRYLPRTDQTLKTPVLVVYGLIGRYTMADLQEDRSLVRNLLDQGIDLYVVDWGQPSRGDRWLSLDDYVNTYLAECVDFVRQRHDVEKINLLGICEGGVFTLCYAALKPKTIRNLIITITPVDFHADVEDERPHHGFINIWTRSLQGEDIDRIVDAYGYVPGELMSFVFMMMTPIKSLTKYNIDLLDVIDDEKKLMNFLRMEKWLADRPHHPGEAAKQWFKDLYQENRLIHNQFKLGGKTVDLSQITMPVLNVFAKDDHIIPPQCSQALGKTVGTQDYTELALPGGHVGVFVSGRSQGILGKEIYDWLAERS